jgi:hypothetical protein
MEEKQRILEDINLMLSVSALKTCKENKIDYFNIKNKKASVKTMKILRSELLKELKLIVREVEKND